MKKFTKGLNRPVLVSITSLILTIGLTACGGGGGGAGAVPIVSDSPQNPPSEQGQTGNPENPTPLNSEPLPLDITIAELDAVIGSRAGLDDVAIDLKIYACISYKVSECEETSNSPSDEPNNSLIYMGSPEKPSNITDIVVESRLVFSVAYYGGQPSQEYQPVIYSNTAGILQAFHVGSVATANASGFLSTKTVYNFTNELGQAIAQNGIEGFGVALINVGEESVNANLVKVAQTQTAPIGGLFRSWSPADSNLIDIILRTENDVTTAKVSVCGQVEGTDLIATFHEWKLDGAGRPYQADRQVQGEPIRENGCGGFLIPERITASGNQFSVFAVQGLISKDF